MLEKYPVLNSNVKITMFGEIAEISSMNNQFQSFNINRDGATLLSKCNGSKQLAGIMKEVLNRNFQKQETKYIAKFLGKLIKMRIIDMNESLVSRELNLKGSMEQITPQVVSLELTNKCNFNCRYCYQNSNPVRNEFLKDPLKLIKNFYENNIKGFELTGGEPLMHPQFEEIISFITANFSILAIITNGSLLRDKHLKLLDDRSCRVVLQVGLDGNSSKMVEETTGVKGSFEMEIDAIKLVKKYGFILRVGMVVDDPFKIDYMEDTLLIAKDLGADSFVATPTINFGRGEDCPQRFTIEDHLRLNDKMGELQKKYKGFFSSETDHIDIDFKILKNCGGGHRNLTVNWNGIMKPCPMVNADELSLGSWTELKSKKVQQKMKAYFDLKSPKKEVCGDCNYLAYCYNCILRGLKASKKKDMCLWVEKNKKLIEEIRK